MKYPAPGAYPKTLHVRDSVYVISFVKKIPKEGHGTLGLCDGHKKRIFIRKGQTPRGTFRTLVHELLHAFEFEYGLVIKHKAIYGLELAIEAFFTDNN